MIESKVIFWEEQNNSYILRKAEKVNESIICDGISHPPHGSSNCPIHSASSMLFALELPNYLLISIPSWPQLISPELAIRL